MTADDDVERQKFALRELFRSYNNADNDTVKTQVWHAASTILAVHRRLADRRPPQLSARFLTSQPSLRSRHVYVQAGQPPRSMPTNKIQRSKHTHIRIDDNCAQVERLVNRLLWASGVAGEEQEEPKMAEEEIYVGDGGEVGQEDEGRTVSRQVPGRPTGEVRSVLTRAWH